MKRILVVVMIVSIVLSMFAIFTPKANASENVIFQDDFESYAVGTFPSSSGWQIVWNGAGDQYQVITDSYSNSPTKSLQLMGSYGWSSVVKKDFSSSSNRLGYEAYLMSPPGGGPDVAFCNIPIQTWGRYYGMVAFATDGFMWACSLNNEGYQKLQAFTPYTWYKIRVLIDRSAKVYDVWIDDVLEGQDIPIYYDPWEILSLQLQVGWVNSKGYFDDVKVFEVSGPPSQGGLVGYWKFDEGSGNVALDGSGNGNTGILENNPIWVDGKYSKALSFDGIDDFVLVQDSVSLHLSSAVTVEAWVYLPIGADFSQGRTILSKDASNGGTGLNFGICNDAGGVQFGVGTDGVYSPIIGLDTPTGYVPRDVWTHVAATYDGSLMKVYVSGVLCASSSWTGGINTDNGRPLTIGKKNFYPWSYEYWMNGIIDDVRIYNRGLSQQEIQTDMLPPPILNHGVAISEVNPRGTSWWRADGSTIEIKEGQLMLLEVTVRNTGDFTENFDLHLFYEDLEASPTKSFLLETSALSLAPSGSTTVDFEWNTKGEHLTDSVHPHRYDILATAHVPGADAVSTSPNIRVLPVLSKDWLLVPQHENSPAMIQWEFPDNFAKDGSAVHNHRRNTPFYALGVWDNRFLTRDEAIGLNWFDQDFDPVKPWLFYYGHGFVSKDTPLRYYFVDISSWLGDACVDIRSAFNAWSNLNDPSRPELATGIFFQEVTSVTDANNPGKDAEILLYWQDLGNILEEGNNKGNPGGTQFVKLADGKWIENMYFNSRNPIGFKQGIGLGYTYTTWYYGDPQEMRLGDYYEPPYAYHNYLPLYCTALHEIGHALGLTHLPEYYQSNQVSEVMFNKVTPGKLGIDKILGETRERALDLYSIPAPYCMVTIHSPAHLYITDPLGRQVGFDPTTHSVVNNVPYAKLSKMGSDPENITISWPLDGSYSIQLTGIATDPYTLEIALSTNYPTVTTQEFRGTISPQEKQTFVTSISETNLASYRCAQVDIDPQSLNLGRKGNWITTYVELGKSFSMQNVNVSSIKLNGTIPVASSTPVTIGDYDSDGVPDLMVKFDRTSVAALILRNCVLKNNIAKATLTISGKLKDGTPFEGSTTIMAILPRGTQL
jgi:hypothetical protein